MRARVDFALQLQQLIDAVQPVPGEGLGVRCACRARPDVGLLAATPTRRHAPCPTPDALADALYWHFFTRACTGTAAGAPAREVAAAGPEGYEFADGRTPPDPLLDRQRDRYYFAVTAAGSARLRAIVQARCDGLGLPFTLKWVRAPAAYARLDSMVLYVPMHLRGLLLRELPRLVGQLEAGMLRSQVPILTLPLRPGVSMAQGLPDGASFGMHRCRLLAGALWQAQRAGIHDRGSRIAAVARHFRAHGIDPEFPYLGPLGATRHVAA